MRVLHELNQLDFGGVEKVVRNIIKFDKDNEHKIIAYKDGLYREELEKAGAKIILSPKQGENISCEADIIHIHSGGGLSNIAINLGKHFPVIETIHSPIRSPMKNEFISQRVGVTDAVSGINHECITIHNGLDLSDLVATKLPTDIKKELGISKGVPIVGRLGRLGRDKFVEEWLVCCNLLQDAGIEFIPLVIGSEARNADGYVGKLKLMAECLPVKDVIWAGNKADIANYLQIMDVFLYPSATEGFGLVFLEALYMGASVVTLDNPVTREILGEHARLTKGGIKGLVEETKQALINPVARVTGKQYVEDNFTAQQMSVAYIKIYTDVYNRGKTNE